MEEFLSYFFYVLAANERTRIDEVDSNLNKWYELIITQTDNSEETVKRGNTFDEISKDCKQYMDKYRFDEINIVICENQKAPEKTYHFFSDALVYSMIHDYYRFSELLENMRFVGEIKFQKNGSSPKIKKAYYNYGEAADIFIDEIAFRYFRHLICYIPDYGEENNPEDGLTYNDFLEITEGNTDLARHLFDEVTWEYPSTLYEQWASSGTLDEHYRHKYDEKLNKMVLSRHASLDELKKNVAQSLELAIKTISDEDLSNKDDESTGFKQADFSLIIDIDPNSIPNGISDYAMATLFYLKDRQSNYVITETQFTFE